LLTASGRTTNAIQYVSGGGKREGAAILACRTEGGAKGQGVDYYLRENEFGELEATVDTIIWFLGLRTES